MMIIIKIIIIIIIIIIITWYEGTPQLLSLTEFKSHFFISILLAEQLNR